MPCAMRSKNIYMMKGDNVKKVKVKCEKFMRVVGYFGAKGNMNDGKLVEHNKRKVMG